MSSDADLDIVFLSGISETGLWSLPRSLLKGNQVFGLGMYLYAILEFLEGTS